MSTDEKLFDVPNLDDLSVEMGDYATLATVFTTLASYCSYKHAAMRFRCAGDEQSALHLELEMERMYRALPAWARW